MDVHKNEDELAIDQGGRNGEVRFYGRTTNSQYTLDKVITKLRKVHSGATFHFVYEAAPCGFTIYRYLQNKRGDIHCIVVASSRIPKRSADKVKTDKRDAIQPARLHRAGELEAIHVPDSRDESIRDLCRARTDAHQELQNAHFRLQAFLLRNGYQYQLKITSEVKSRRDPQGLGVVCTDLLCLANFFKKLKSLRPSFHHILEGFISDHNDFQSCCGIVFSFEIVIFFRTDPLSHHVICNFTFYVLRGNHRYVLHSYRLIRNHFFDDHFCSSLSFVKE